MLILDMCHLGTHARLNTGSRLFPERGWLILQTTRQVTVTDILQERTRHQCPIPTFITRLPHPPRKAHTPLESKRRHHMNGHPTQVNHFFSAVLLRLNEKEKTHARYDGLPGCRRHAKGIKRGHRRNIYRVRKYGSVTCARLKSDFHRGWPCIM